MGVGGIYMNLGRNIPKLVKVQDHILVKALDVDTEKVVRFLCTPCPNCGKWIVVNSAHNYCEWCGQALEWQESKL